MAEGRWFAGRCVGSSLDREFSLRLCAASTGVAKVQRSGAAFLPRPAQACGRLAATVRSRQVVGLAAAVGRRGWLLECPPIYFSLRRRG